MRLDFHRQGNYITIRTKKETVMRTGRPRSFCKDEALDKAMTVFWRQGYEGASMADLTKAMGINPPSLYACFGSKEGLFKAVLARYEERRAGFMENVLAAPTAAEVAATYLMGVAAFSADTSGRNPPGCLMVQGGLSCGDTLIPDTLARHRAEKEAMLHTRFEEAKRSGDLPQLCDPAALARYLMVMANGICVQAGAGATLEELREVANIALASWPAMVAACEPATHKEEELI
jgi:AcrR family transcriptional regulator